LVELREVERTKVVCCDYDAIFEFQCYYGRSGDDWRLCVGCWAVVLALEVGRIVWAINIVSGLDECQLLL
jgi:hypothetical protein